MLFVNDDLAIGESDLQESFVRSSGPGGQNVNKVATAVQLRFNVAETEALSPEVKLRLDKIAGSRMTTEGVLIIDARRHRTREMNRADARERLVEMIRRALEPPKPRRKTRPSKGQKLRRLGDKKKQSSKKDMRRRPAGEE